MTIPNRDSLGASALDSAIMDLIIGVKDAEMNFISQPEPFYGNLISKMGRKISNSETKGVFRCPTAMVMVYQNRIWLVVNEDFFNKLTRIERVKVVKHEAQHIAHRHLFRFDQSKYKSRRRANIAMDAVINQFNDGLPNREIEGYTKPGKPFEPIDWRQIEGATADKSYEHYYELLEKEQDPRDDDCQNGQQGGGSGDGEGDNGDGDQDDNNGITETSAGDMFDDHSHFGKPADGNESNGEMVEEQLKETIRKTARGLPPGSMRGDIQAILDDINADSKIPWQVLLRRWMKQSVRRVRRMNIMRESLSVPGIFPGFKKDPVPEFHCYADMSGSVDDEQAKGFFREVLTIQKKMKATVWLHQFDTEIHCSEKIDRQVPNIVRDGYGGTNFQCIIDHAKENKIRNILIMTDGFAPSVDTRGLNVLWVLTSYHQEHEGKKIVLEDV